MNTIKHTPEQFSGTGEVRGFYFGRICKTERGFLYEVTLNGITAHHEELRVKVNKRLTRENYPISKAFGI